MIDEIIKFNEKFVEDKSYQQYVASKYPDKKLAIVSCMDTRLTELLPAALGLRNGDAKFIKNAGGVISHPFGSVMRSLIIAIYELDVKDVMVVAHSDCGTCKLDSSNIIDKMKERGISQQSLDLVEFCGVDYNSWLRGFDNLEESVRQTMRFITENPLIPKDVGVHGFVIDSHSGLLTKIASNQE
ncbi:MAG: carbonic anhydrase [Rikenellaceae bacterium]